MVIEVNKDIDRYQESVATVSYTHLAGYLGYLINGAWTEGIAFNEFMDRFNEVCAVPLSLIHI